MNQKEITYNCTLFDGEKVRENVAVVLKEGKVISITETENDGDCFLMPGLIDAHAHISSSEHIASMLENGVTASCDVSANAKLIEEAKPFTVISSSGMAISTFSGKSYVKKAIESGAKYIKVLLMEPNLMPKFTLKDICKTAHKNSLKVAVHATSVKAIKMSVDCGADILIHVPMKEDLPEELARLIAQKEIAVIPTLVMMETFAENEKSGYKKSDYKFAENNVKLLYKNGVRILAGTDANTGSFAPAVPYGTSMHRELTLLAKAGMTPSEVLKSATSNVADVFGLENIGRILPGQKNAFLVINGRPDKDINDIKKINRKYTPKA